MRGVRWVVAAAAMATCMAGLAVGQTALKPGPVPVRNEPYTAENVGSTYQVLANGTKIEHHGSSEMARDSRGRTWNRTEMKRDPLRPGPVQYWVTTYDPDTRTELRWCTCSKYVTATHFAEPRPLPPEHDPGMEGLDVYLGPSPTERLKYHGESTGPMMLQGVMTRGSKAVRVIPAGVDGNDHELTRTILSWYSPELHLAMSTIIDDPVEGLRKHEFINLKQVEPDPKLWEIPAGYMVREAAAQ